MYKRPLLLELTVRRVRNTQRCRQLVPFPELNNVLGLRASYLYKPS